MATKWLDEREQRAWRGFHKINKSLMPYVSQQLGQDSGLSSAEYEVLVTVSEASGQRMRARDLGRTIAWERSRVSHQISRMEKRGLVAREACDDDARGSYITLTDDGRAAIEQAAPLHAEHVRHCFADVLTPEQLDVLGDIGDAISTHVAEHHGDAADDCCDR